jgi:signal transduction histidine kinase/ActR/RegA family two-component response regulator
VRASPGIAEGRQASLFTLSPGPRERRLALSVIAVSGAIFLAAVPFAKVPLVPMWPFIPIYQSTLAVNDLITAVLLLGQYRFLRARALAVLAAGYVFTGIVAAAHMLTFPGLFAPTGLLGAGPQTTAWLYMFWHGGFPGFVVAYAWLKGKAEPTAPAASAARGAYLAITASVTLAVAVTLLATVGQGLLPVIMRGHGYTSNLLAVITTTWALSLVALVTLWRRRPHSVLDLWLMVVMCAWLFDIALAGVLNAGRFDLGFYAGRIYGWLAATFVLVVLLVENARLYARLVVANEALAVEVAERRRAEDEADAASRAKSEFLSRMSHELRTPLNSVIGFGQLLEMDRLTEEQKEAVERILSAGRHLLGLINEVLEISRIEAGVLRMSLEPVPVAETIESAVSLVRPLADKRAIHLQVALPSLDRHVVADRQRLQQVLLNLLSNAVKYNREAGRIAVACADGAGRLTIQVTDTGHGVGPTELQRLFTPFERLGAETSGIEGTGLGLSLSRRLVEAMGGRLTMESQVGVGSTLTVDLAVALAPGAEVAASAALEAATPALGGTVLYVEDNLSNFRLVERVLQRRPEIKLLSALQGRLGLELARNHRPDLILLDLHLPDVPGLEVLRRLREMPATAGIPVVIVSADATPGQVKRLLESGATAYLTKPLDVRQFLDVVDRTLMAKDSGLEGVAHAPAPVPSRERGARP